MDALSRNRRRIYEILEVARPGDTLSRVVDISLVSLVAVNVLAVILNSVDDLAIRYEAGFLAFEVFSVVIFSIELALRIWISVETSRPDTRGSRLRYIFSPLAIADILAIIPFYLSAMFSLDLRFLRILRLLRLFKLTRYSGALAGVKEVLRVNRGAFVSAFAMLILAMIVSASVMYIVENEAQPEAFSSIPAAMWWAVATLTTVGYGDVTPITGLGKMIASVITILGVCMVALPTSIMASGFLDLHQRNRGLLEAEATAAFGDGYLSSEEASHYAQLAESLGVDPQEAERIITLARQSISGVNDEDCPHCGKSRS
jgi:voltage-gated potassium channel